MYHQFSVIETVKTSWRVLKKNFITLVVYSAISLFVYGGSKMISLFLIIDDSYNGKIIFGLAQMVVQSYLTLSFYRLILTLMDKEYYEFEFKEILPTFSMTLTLFVIGLMITVLILIIMILNFFTSANPFVSVVFQYAVVLSLLYLLVRSIFCLCFIVDDNSKPLESLKQSFEITRDNFFNALFIVLIIAGIMLLSLLFVSAIAGFFISPDSNVWITQLPFYVWFIFVFPSVQVLIMVTYRKLVYSHLDVDDDLSETL
jgi:hypothetical protein